MPRPPHTPDSTPIALRDGALLLAVISPDRQRHILASGALARCGNVHIRDIDADTATIEEVRDRLGQSFDGVLIDLDVEPRRALALVEGLCIDSALIVMVFSSRIDPELLLHAMRAGAREFFTVPFQHDAIAKALVWVSAHRRPAPPTKCANGRLRIFFGSKGGVGVTTLACNFAAALATRSEQSTLLIDLNLLLGDAALNLGILAPHSVADALEHAQHPDAKLFDSLLVRHSSGLSVLGAPEEVPNTVPSGAQIGKLLAVARLQFDNIVIDAGKKIDLRQMHLFVSSATAYLVTQVGIPELRNANRLIAQFSPEDSPKLEIVINRYQSRFLGLTDEHLAKALTRPVRWKIPNDFKAVSAMQTTGMPFVFQDSSIAAVIRQMADAACKAPVLVVSKDVSNPPQSHATSGFGAPRKAPTRKFGAEASLAASGHDH